MNTTLEERKEKNTAYEKKDIYIPYINGFKKSNKVCFCVNFCEFLVNQEPEIEAKMNEIEKNINVLVMQLHTNTPNLESVMTSY